MNIAKAALAACMLAACVATPPPQSVRVIDGDTIELDGRTVRLWGVDAPEAAQTCESGPGSPPVAAGEQASARLAQIVSAGPVACQERDLDRYGRSVATCEAGGADIAAAMVRDGWALDWARYSGGAYAEIEAQARADRRGVWALACVAPWDWRRQR